MKNELTRKQTDEILQTLDKAIKTGPWTESNFLRVIGKKLTEIRDNFAGLLSSHKELTNPVGETSEEEAARRTGQQEIFIALYSSEGSNLQSWERILANLPRQMIARPIYADEESASSLIRTKENKVNEAYVVVYIDKADIMAVQSDKIPLDKCGNPLLNLKDRSLNLNNITRFVHLSGTYTYTKGRLIKSN